VHQPAKPSNQLTNARLFRCEFLHGRNLIPGRSENSVHDANTNVLESRAVTQLDQDVAATGFCHTQSLVERICACGDCESELSAGIVR
jgi:hypothetical protein